MSLDHLIAPASQLKKVAGGFQGTEGPVFSRRGYLLFSETVAKRIMKWEAGKVSVFREKSNGSLGLTFDHQGRLLACEAEAKRVTRTEKNGAITVLAKGLTEPNDLVYAIDGSVYFTDLPASRVYQVTRKGEVRVVAEDCKGPNGLALSPNQQKLYVADYLGKKVRVYDIEPDGKLRGGRDFAAVEGDGIKTDEGGNVWVADGEGVAVFSAAGEQQGTLKVQESPSNLTFGDGFHGLYITARTSVYHIPTRVAGTRTY
ncbi:MAG: SMP-30/gluconolactonase/LRE family protein [Bryobacteraceae bacterium]